LPAQLFSTNAFSGNTFSLNVLSTFTAIYSQSIANTNNFISYFYQRKQISLKWHRIYLDQNNTLRVIRLEVLGQSVSALNVLVLNSCAALPGRESTSNNCSISLPLINSICKFIVSIQLPRQSFTAAFKQHLTFHLLLFPNVKSNQDQK